MSRPARHFYEFGPFRVDVANRLLLREGEPVPLTIKAFDTLLALVENSGQVLEKDELMKRVWPDAVVEENNLTQNVSALRKIIGEDTSGRRYIETLPRRGYRFVGNVQEVFDDAPEIPEIPEIIVQRQSRSRIVIEQQSEMGDYDAARTAALPEASRSRARAIIAACGIVVAVAAGLYFWLPRAPSQRTIAVLPFKPLVADAKDQYLEMGMADALITKLSNIKQIIVRPTSSVLKYADSTEDAVTAGRALGVDSVLDGSIQRAGDKIRITVRLVRVSDGAPLWADTFDESFTNIFSVQDSISQRMADVLAPKLTGEEKKRLAKRYTENTDAYQAYLKGRFYWVKWNGPALQKSIDYFQQAIEKDPDYALAYSGLADSYNLLGYLSIWPPKEAFPKSEEAARKALAMDDTLSEAHLSLAKTKLFYDWNWTAFESELKRSLELDPNFPDVHGLNGAYLAAMGRFEESLRERKRAQELDPLSPLYATSFAWSYFYSRQFDKAIEWYKKALELDPNYALAHNDLGTAYARKGMDAEAVEEFLIGRSLAGASPEDLAALKQAYAASGINGYWRKELDLANERLKQGHVGPHRMARIYAELGDKDHAFEWLEKAYEERDSLLIFINTVPIFDSLHSDPRFGDLIRRIGLAR